MPYHVRADYCGICHERAMFAAGPDAATAGDGDCEHKARRAICEQCPTRSVCREQTNFGDVALIDCIRHDFPPPEMVAGIEEMLEARARVAREDPWFVLRI